MNSRRKILAGIVATLAIGGLATQATHAAEPLKANVIHWWTSGGESAAIRQFADAYD